MTAASAANYRRKAHLGVVECACGKVVVKRSPAQKFCPECSAERDAERQRKWAKNHPPSKEAIKNREQRKKSRTAIRGAEISALNAVSIADVMSPPVLEWVVRVALPFSYSASKNATWANGGGGHVYRRQKSRAYQDHLAALVREATKDVQIKRNKVWLDIYVQKPNHRGDAANVVDLVCDAVKEAIGVDDRWFCIRHLDWQVTKANPKIFVGIGQEAVEDAIVCSSCGRVLTMENFSKNRHSKMGHTRQCRECVRKPAAITQEAA